MHDSGHDARQCNAPSGELFRTYHSGQSVPACLQCGGLHRRGALCRHRRPGGRGYGQPRNEHHHPGRFGALHWRIGADERIFRRAGYGEAAAGICGHAVSGTVFFGGGAGAGLAAGRAAAAPAERSGRDISAGPGIFVHHFSGYAVYLCLQRLRGGHAQCGRFPHPHPFSGAGIGAQRRIGRGVCGRPALGCGGRGNCHRPRRKPFCNFMCYLYRA